MSLIENTILSWFSLYSEEVGELPMYRLDNYLRCFDSDLGWVVPLLVIPPSLVFEGSQSVFCGGVYLFGSNPRCPCPRRGWSGGN
jgi:hypothetical protein